MKPSVIHSIFEKRSLFAKRDVASETRDQYGRWTVGTGNTSGGAKAYAHWALAHRGTVKGMVAQARAYAGKRGEQLRRKVFEANGREFQRRGLDKEKSQRKRLNSLFDIHGAHMALIAPEEHSATRAAIMAHALQHNEGPLGRLTPAYRAMIQRRVKTALAAEGIKMSTAMSARKPRTPAAAKPKTRSMAGASNVSTVKKYNQEHDELGRFSGPGGSHDPTGNPPGRPSTGAKAPLTPGQAFGQAAISTAGSIGAGFAAGRVGQLIGGAAGAALGGPPGAAIGMAAGSVAGNILGSLAGDYVGSKIGQSLLGIKEQMDGHTIGTGEAIGSLASIAPEAASLIPGARVAGGLIGAGARLFAPEATSFASHAASGAVDLAGITAGQAVDRGAAPAGRAAGRAVSKGLFDAPKGYDGTFGSMAAQAPEHLFGPRAWKKIAGTPFGSYIRQKIKDTTDKMDDAAEAQGIGLKPAKPKDVQAAGQVIGQQQQAEMEAQQQQAQMDQQAQQQTMQVQDKTAGNQHKRDMEMNAAMHGQKMEYGAAKHKQQMERMRAQAKTPPKAPPKAPVSPPGRMKKGLAPNEIPMRGPNDVVFNAYRTGGAANARFLARMQESDRKSRGAQLNLAFAQPKAENLARKPSEDEQQYQQRVQQLMAESVKMSDRLRPQLFSGGSAETKPIYRARAPKVAKGFRKTAPKRSQTTPMDENVNFAMSVEFAKDYNTPDTLAQGLVYGWASIIEKDGIEITDHQGDRITSDELMKGAHDFVKNSRQGGVLHDEYGHNIGHIVESVVFTKELQDRLGINLGKVGWLIGYQITDPRVKTLVKSGVLKAFSIGGRGRREAVANAAA
jgi:hypothetical protein